MSNELSLSDFSENIQKGFKEFDLQKATYTNNSENRKLGRVGKEYGGKGSDQGNGKEKRPTPQTYFETASGAVQHAKSDAEYRGYEVDDHDWMAMATGGKYTKMRPSVDETKSFSVGLTKDGKEQDKALHITLYGMPSGKFELTSYIN